MVHQPDFCIAEKNEEEEMKTIPRSCFPIHEKESLYSSLKKAKGVHNIEDCLRCEHHTAEERMLDRFLCTNCGFAWEAMLLFGEYCLYHSPSNAMK